MVDVPLQCDFNKSHVIHAIFISLETKYKIHATLKRIIIRKII